MKILAIIICLIPTTAMAGFCPHQCETLMAYAETIDLRMTRLLPVLNPDVGVEIDLQKTIRDTDWSVIKRLLDWKPERNGAA